MIFVINRCFNIKVNSVLQLSLDCFYNSNTTCIKIVVRAKHRVLRVLQDGNIKLDVKFMS